VADNGMLKIGLLGKPDKKRPGNILRRRKVRLRKVLSLIRDALEEAYQPHHGRVEFCRGIRQSFALIADYREGH
jgi:hypothetical protein